MICHLTLTLMTVRKVQKSPKMQYPVLFSYEKNRRIEKLSNLPSKTKTNNHEAYYISLSVKHDVGCLGAH